MESYGLVFLGFVLGLLGNWITTCLFTFWQFKGSTAWRRIHGVRRATDEFRKLPVNALPAQDQSIVSRKRDEFRYSLGVMIHYLTEVFGNPISGEFSASGPWPLVTDFGVSKAGDERFILDDEGKQIDRWAFFNRYVRPVLEDINPSTVVLNLYWPFGRAARKQLRALLDLCLSVESATAKVDAAVEVIPLLEIEQANGKWVMFPKSQYLGGHRLNEVQDAMRTLHSAWKNWVGVSA